jgi:peptide/nickel transport system substrate-binding protein
MPSDTNAVDRRGFLKAAGGATIAATMAGCAGGGGGEETTTEEGGDGEDTSRVVYARGSDSTTLDAQATTTGEDAKVTNQVYDKLIHFEPGETTLVGGLAENFQLEGKTATLELREGVTFHNGDEFTADDFVATYRRFVVEDYEAFIGVENQSIYGPYLLGSAGGVTAVDDYTLEFQLASRYAPFLGNLAVFALAVMPKSLIEGDHDFSDEPVGTGPFSFDEWDTGNQVIRLSANQDYWGQVPKVDEVVFRAIGENSTRAQALDTGEVDIIDGVGSQQVDQIEGYDGASVERAPGMTIGYMAFNLARFEPFRNKKVRKAISHAINTKAIVENIYEGLAVDASHPLPPNVMGHNPDLEPYPHDPEKAEQLLAEAGYEDGFSFELATMTNPRPYFASPVQTAETVRSNLEAIGLEVTINEQSWEPYLTYTQEGKHDACFLGWISDNGDPDNFYSPLLHPGVAVEDVPEGQDWVSRDMEGMNTGNRAAWANTDFMELVDEGKKNYNEDEREEIYLEASAITHDEAPWVFMTHTEEIRGVHERVSGFVVDVIGGPFLNLVEV